jgi:phosphoadenosine phosphosulfate reductase
MAEFAPASASELLSWAMSTYGNRFGIATSFQKEGMVIVDLAARIDPHVRIFTLDTGRLPEETYQMMETVRSRYGTPVEIVAPERAEVEKLVAVDGPNLFYRSVEARKSCCDVRKVRPLARKLTEFDAWATGLRREQSETRAKVERIERGDGRVKISPLVDWTDADVEGYILQYDVPVHPLYARGYASIGCAPCTRAVQPGEDSRAGRWWWEEDAHKECGIHFAPDGSVSRVAPTQS